MCLPGLEALVERELRDLGIKSPRARHGGVEFRASTRQLYLANTWLRTATRVVVRAGELRARSFAELEARLREIDLSPWLREGDELSVSVTSRASVLYHTDAIAQRVARAFAGVGGPTVFVRFDHDRAVISIDASGEPLHHRGWRLATAKAPLRPTLAAAMVLASSWDRRSPLVDPFCGAGTIAIEAALIAAGRPPWTDREFAFARWPSFEPGTWASVRATFAGAACQAPPIVAGDRDAGAIEAAQANARRAGADAAIEFVCDSFSATLDRAPGAWVLTNPPYDRRVKGGSRLIRALYQRRPHNIGVLIADRAPRPAGAVEKLHTANGGVPVWFYETTSSV